MLLLDFLVVLKAGHIVEEVKKRKKLEFKLTDTTAE